MMKNERFSCLSQLRSLVPFFHAPPEFFASLVRTNVTSVLPPAHRCGPEQVAKTFAHVKFLRGLASKIVDNYPEANVPLEAFHSA